MACCTRWIVINSNNELTFQSSHLTSDDCNESVIKFLTLRVDGTTELIRYAYGKVEYIAPPMALVLLGIGGMSVAPLSLFALYIFWLNGSEVVANGTYCIRHALLVARSHGWQALSSR